MDLVATTVLWQMFRTGRENARAVMLPGGPPHTLALFADDVMDRAEQFDDLDIALFRSEEIKRSLADDGWTEAE